MTITTDNLISQVDEHLMGGDRDEMNFLFNDVQIGDSALSLEQPLAGVTQGSYLAIELEMLYVTSVDPISGQVSVKRGFNGSTEAEHDAGTVVYVNPIFSHWSIYRSLNVEIVSLSAADNGLFAVKAFTLLTQPVQMTYDVQAENLDLRDFLEIRWDQTGAERAWPRIPLRHVLMLRELQTDTGTTGLSFRIGAPSFITSTEWSSGTQADFKRSPRH